MVVLGMVALLHNLEVLDLWPSGLQRSVIRSGRTAHHRRHPKGSKVAGAEAVSARFKAGRVLLPESAPRLDVFLHEMTTFPVATMTK